MPRVVVRAGTFQGEADPYFQAADFERFLRELRLFLKELRGTATFTTLENQLGFSLTGDGLGREILEKTSFDLYSLSLKRGSFCEV